MIQNSLHLLFTINFDPSFGPSHYHLWKSITAQTKIATTMNSTPIMLIISFYYKKNRPTIVSLFGKHRRVRRFLRSCDTVL